MAEELRKDGEGAADEPAGNLRHAEGGRPTI